MENQAETAGAAFGRAIGAVITAFFGFVWFAWGFSAFRHIPLAIEVGYFSMALVLMVVAVMAVRRGRKMMTAPGVQRSDFWEKRGKAFGIVLGLEFVGCFILVALVNAFHRPDWTAAAISFVVGLHFLPLGKIFEFPAYYWVGSLMVASDILTVTALKSWNPIASACFATGAILWTAAIYILVRSFRVTAPAPPA